ncbi:hypothetical protein CBR_g21275 [Chara braunii]|uniref:Uncharacterized protein n=1 Tax=Chara braunii TaxID=69332 RepID=A0A388L157_CHABU|nr:hypothetical protein CBR_g21275 [Chara braunii]|eukprot:GBG76035.1 hypothetical protein CBR_g21275 [Chara braunii]
MTLSAAREDGSRRPNFWKGTRQSSTGTLSVVSITFEAMKRLVRKDSSTVKVYGLNAYSKVRVVYLGDDQTRRYFNVSCFDNTRENHSMMLSFEDVVRDIRQWWIDNNRIEVPKAKVIEKDKVAVAHQKTWQNFLRACMGKACDKAFVKQALENEYSKDCSNKLRGYMNLATSSVAVWPLVERFFEMFNEGKLSVGDCKIPLDMPGRMEGRLPGPYTDKTKGQRTLYHCIYATDGPKGSTVSWKDLRPSYFKNFGDLTCREREVALLLLMKGKVVATNVKVLPPRVNTECLLDIMRKERYMVRMFNYVLFRAEGRADDEWNDAFFMSYKDLEDRYGPNGLCVAEWEKERDKLYVNKVKMVPRRLGGVEEARQGAGLGPTTTMYKEAPFHLKLFIYTAIDKLDLLRAEVKRIASSALHIVCDKLGKQTTLLPVCMPSKEVLAAPDDIVAATQKMTCRAAIVDIPSSNFSTAWTSHEFDALHTLMTKCCGQNRILFFFAPHKVQSDVLRHLFRWEDVEVIPGTWKRVDRPLNDITRYGNMAMTSRDMMAIVLHAEGGDLKKAGQREDDGTTVVKTQEVHMTSMPQISVAMTKPSKRMDVSNALSSDAGATYGSLLLTCAALEGTSEMQSESGVGLSVPDNQLQQELCTGKGDAQSPLTPQGGAAADGGKGGDVEKILHSRNLETLTDDFDYEDEGGNDVVNTRGL